MIAKLSEEEAQELLQRNELGRLGCIADDRPYVVPVNYLYDGDSVYIHSLPGRKIAALRRHPQACLQVDEIERERSWRSVIAFGRYEEIGDEQRRAYYLKQLLRRFPHLTPVESRLVINAGPVEVILFAIHIEEVTGLKEEW